jgi:hypothetical protein
MAVKFTEKKVLRRALGSKRKGGLRKLNSDECHNLYSSSDIFSPLGYFVLPHSLSCTLYRQGWRLDVFMAVNIWIAVFWVTMPYSLVGGYQLFDRTYCHFPEDEGSGFPKRW